MKNIKFLELIFFNTKILQSDLYCIWDNSFFGWIWFGQLESYKKLKVIFLKLTIYKAHKEEKNY